MKNNNVTFSWKEKIEKLVNCIDWATPKQHNQYPEKGEFTIYCPRELKHPSQGWTILILLHFSKTCEFWSSKANWHLRFSLLSITLADLLGNRSLLQRAQKVIDCKLWISIHFVCFSVPRFVACHHNYDRQQQKTHLWWTSECVCFWKAQ